MRRKMSEHRAKIKSDDSEGGGDDWMLTYGDLMTQLVCFFVLLMSFSVTSSMDFREVVVSLHEALSGTGVFSAWRSAVEDTTPFQRQEEVESLLELQGYLETSIKEVKMSDYMETSMGKRGLVIRLKEGGSPVFFDTGDARIKEEAFPILNRIGQVIEDIPNDICVEGHTDNRPIHTSQFPSNWELSAMRATNVLRYLHGITGIAPERLSAVGYGPYRPMDSNDTESGMSKNRRVEILILRSNQEES
jgi:chemotaxis protein MotB